MRRFLTLMAVGQGALVGLILTAFFRVGAKSCQDVFTTVVTSACALPQAAPWALVLGALLGGVVGLLVAQWGLAIRR